MDSAFVAGLSKLRLDSPRYRRDDDFSDRLSHTFSTVIIVAFSLVISCRQYIGKPIACWVPTEFTRAQEEYAENVCWVTRTYYVSTMEQNVPHREPERYRTMIGYYQWVPLVLLIQAFLFNLPCLVWRLFNWQSGIQLSSISSFSFWVYKSAFRSNRTHFVRKFLKLRSALEVGDKKRSFQFVDDYLRPDGVFILRLVAQNAGELVASEVTEALWHCFRYRPAHHMNDTGRTGPGVGGVGGVSGVGGDSEKKVVKRKGAQQQQQQQQSQQQPLNGVDDDPGEFV